MSKRRIEPVISISVELQDRKIYVSASTEEKALDMLEKVWDKGESKTINFFSSNEELKGETPYEYEITLK